jgi:hypothetical protein
MTGLCSLQQGDEQYQHARDESRAAVRQNTSD